MEAQIARLEGEQGRKVKRQKAEVDQRHEHKNIAALRANLAAAEKKMEEKRQEAEEAKRAIEEKTAAKVAKVRAKLQFKHGKDMVAMNEAAEIHLPLRSVPNCATALRTAPTSSALNRPRRDSAASERYPSEARRTFGTGPLKGWGATSAGRVDTRAGLAPYRDKGP
ncbi:MAG: hypothetical protein M1826_001364 [Phylliscum demangeonii]|nr:MAG: hypothetical protein M1826_001364 [Phylliscum demangeonii]